MTDAANIKQKNKIILKPKLSKLFLDIIVKWDKVISKTTSFMANNCTPLRFIKIFFNKNEITLATF